MKIIVFTDRDGTLIYDNKYYLGSTNDWKEKVKFLPTVIDGLKLLKSKKILVYIITNQPGIAIKEFPLLNEKRAKDACEYLIEKLKVEGIAIDGYSVCPYASKEYVKNKKQFTFDENYVKDHDCIKPKTGMISKIVKKIEEEKSIYVIGDRITDVQTALNADGTGILIPFKSAKKIKKKNAFIVKNFLEAAKLIIKRESL